MKNTVIKIQRIRAEIAAVNAKASNLEDRLIKAHDLIEKYRSNRNIKNPEVDALLHELELCLD